MLVRKSLPGLMRPWNLPIHSFWSCCIYIYILKNKIDRKLKKNWQQFTWEFLHG
jgi:hypothetical protein